MNAKVKVCGDEAGNVIVRSQNNPEYGHIRVEQSRMVIDDGGFAKRKKISALIPGTIDDLKGFDWRVNEEVPGQIIIKESLLPFNPKDPERDFKIAGASGVLCTKGGSPIYRKHFYSLNPNAADILEQHDNTEEIQMAYASEDKEVEFDDDLSL